MIWRIVPAALAGFVAGVAIDAGLSSRWPDLSGFLGSPAAVSLIAGFGGVLVAGVINYLLARRASRETLRRDQEARIEQEHTGAIRVQIVVQRLTNFAHNISETVAQARAMLPEGTDAGETWTTLTPTIAPLDSVTGFATEDFIAFVKARESDVLNDCLKLADDVSTLKLALVRYNELRAAWNSFSVAHATLETNADGSVSTAFTEQRDVQAARMYAHELGDLVRFLASQAPILAERGKELTVRLNKIVRAYFGSRPGIKLIISNESAVQETA